MKVVDAEDIIDTAEAEAEAIAAIAEEAVIDDGTAVSFRIFIPKK